MRPLLRGLRLVAGCLLAGMLAPRPDAAEVSSPGPGPWPVATSHLEVRPQADAKAMFDYLNGVVVGAGTRYLTDILVHPDAVPTLQVEVPAEPQRYGHLAGTRLPVVLLIVYPTTPDNPRADYVFPYTETGDRTFSHMQGPGEAPLLAEPGQRHPLLVLSGGYNTHGLWHLFELKELAAHGYIVVDLFHGDGRSGLFAGNLALRGLALRAALDFLLRDPHFGPAIDPARIGVIGESAGAYTAVAALGGTDPSGRVPPLPDPRVKAAFVVVPYLGGTFGFWPFKVDAWHFGEDYAGLRGVTRPVGAVYGGKDTNVEPGAVEAALRTLAGPVTAVMLDDETHDLSGAAHRDIRAWQLLFFDAWLRDDPAARRRLVNATTVTGGTKDHRSYQRSAGAPARWPTGDRDGTDHENHGLDCCAYLPSRAGRVITPTLIPA